PTAAAAMAHNEIFPSGRAQPAEIGDRVFRPRQDQDIDVRWGDRIAQIMNRYVGFVFQWFEIRIIRNSGKTYDTDCYCRRLGANNAAVKHRGVLLRDTKTLLIGQHPQHWNTGS